MSEPFIIGQCLFQCPFSLVQYFIDTIMYHNCPLDEIGSRIKKGRNGMFCQMLFVMITTNRTGEQMSE